MYTAACTLKDYAFYPLCGRVLARFADSDGEGEDILWIYPWTFAYFFFFFFRIESNREIILEIEFFSMEELEEFEIGGREGTSRSVAYPRDQNNSILSPFFPRILSWIEGGLNEKKGGMLRRSISNLSSSKVGGIGE